jgi:hypothetical protein
MLLWVGGRISRLAALREESGARRWNKNEEKRRRGRG